MSEDQEEYVSLYRTRYRQGVFDVFIYARGGYRKVLTIRLRESLPKITRRWA